MMNPTTPSCAVFDGTTLLARGAKEAVVSLVRKRLSEQPEARILAFDDRTGQVLDLDLRETPSTSAGTAPETGARGRGRPKLGVIAREVTLLPRHWEWLAAQPGGASPALRRLIDEARRGERGQTQARLAQEAAYRFMTALAGDLPGYEEALRALFAGEETHFATLIAGWPVDVRTYAHELAWGSLREER